MSTDEGLDPKTRAEDIILGSLGFGESASILSIAKLPTGGFAGNAQWSDGEEFQFESEEDLSELEEWALEVLLSRCVEEAPTR